METSDGWELAEDGVRSRGARWVIVDSMDDLAQAARRYGVSDRAIALLEHRIPGAHPPAPNHAQRARLDRSPDGELILTTPTLSLIHI